MVLSEFQRKEEQGGGIQSYPQLNISDICLQNFQPVFSYSFPFLPESTQGKFTALSLFCIFFAPPQKNFGFFSKSARSCTLSKQNQLSHEAGLSAPVIRDCAHVSVGGGGEGREVQRSCLPLVFKSSVPRTEPQGAAPKDMLHCSDQSAQSLLPVSLWVRAPL